MADLYGDSAPRAANSGLPNDAVDVSGAAAGDPGFARRNYRKFKAMRAKSLLRFMRIGNLCNAACWITTGVLGVIYVVTSLSIPTIFMSIYLFIFGCILCCFECRWGRIEESMRQSFGFMFSYIGRTIFLCFVATVCFGTVTGSDNSTIWFSYFAGAITVVNAIFNFVVIYCHPSFKKALNATDDPASTYKTAESSIAASALNFARSNPEMAANAFQTTAQYATQNPEIAGTTADAKEENPWA